MDRTLKTLFAFVLVFLLFGINCKKVDEPYDPIKYTSGTWIIEYQRDPSAIRNPDGSDHVAFQIQLAEHEGPSGTDAEKLGENTFRAVMDGYVAYRSGRPKTMENTLIVHDGKLYNGVDHCSVSTGENVVIYFVDHNYDIIYEVCRDNCNDKKATFLKFYLR